MAALAIITATLWYGISYGSPCAPNPSPQQQAALQPQPLPSSLIIFTNYSLFPQLWCPAGQYSVYGQARTPSDSPLAICPYVASEGWLQPARKRTLYPSYHANQSCLRSK